eukprot:m.151666 g.151666  ORF g.151666 m.151666 type:complete len:621 (-) comp15041_c0_seq1:110-1972(-)
MWQRQLDANTLSSTAGRMQQDKHSVQTLRDWATTFMPAFESCVEAGGLGMMCSFNSIRGTPACGNHRSMTTWARQQWNFSGYMVSDQGAAYGIYSDHKFASSIAEAAAIAVKGGLDVEDANDEQHTAFSGLGEALSQGLLSEADLDQSVSRLFYVRMLLGEFDPAENNPYRSILTSEIRSERHLNLTREAAEKSFVLLRNEENVLPQLTYPPKVGLVGPFSDCPACYYGKYSPHKDVGVTISLAEALNETKSSITVAPGCESPACEDYDKKSIVDAVSSSDLVILAVGLGSKFESEGMDRPNMELPGNQGKLVQDTINIAKNNSEQKHIRVIVVLFAAGPVLPATFDGADAILVCFYPAESTGIAVRNTLFGNTSPGGRLPFSWPIQEDAVPAESNYTMAGRTYRYNQTNVKWDFGYGLTYSTIEYSSPNISTSVTVCEPIQVEVVVSNKGDYDVDEVVQVYVNWDKMEPEAETPDLSLGAFQRVLVKKKASVSVKLEVPPRQMAVLTPPLCGVVPDGQGMALWKDSVGHVSDAITQDACCMACAKTENCEAYTFNSSSCELYASYTLPRKQAGAVSGQPLNQWNVRPGRISVSIRRSSSQTITTNQVSIQGAEKPLSQC